MGNKDKKNEDVKAIEVGFKVSMHCNACERSVAKVISTFKGVDTFITDRNQHKVVVKGRINPQKLLKKLKKKTRKRVEIITNRNNIKEDEIAPPQLPGIFQTDVEWQQPIVYDFLRKEELYLIFNDENPNACSTM